MALFAGELHTLERLLRSAFASTGRLAAAAAEAHASRNLSVVSGHQVFSAISKVQGDLGTALSGSAQAHRLIEALGKSMGIDVAAYGESDKAPSERSNPFTSAELIAADIDA